MPPEGGTSLFARGAIPRTGWRILSISPGQHKSGGSLWKLSFTTLYLRHFLSPGKGPVALVEPRILGHELADLGDPEGEEGKTDDDQRLEQIGEDGEAQRLRIRRHQAVDDEGAMEQREAQELVAEGEQGAIGQNLPPRAPG